MQNGQDSYTRVQLPDELEAQFKTWYARKADLFGLNENPDDPKHKYDYRSAFVYGDEPDETGHWPSRWKLPDHPNRFVGGVDTSEWEPGQAYKPRVIESGKASLADVEGSLSNLELLRSMAPKTAGQAVSAGLRDPIGATAEALPFVGSGIDWYRIGKITSALERLERGGGTSEDVERVRSFYVDSLRKPTMGWMVAMILAEAPGFIGEMAVLGGPSKALAQGAVKGMAKRLNMRIGEMAVERSFLEVAKVAQEVGGAGAAKLLALKSASASGELALKSGLMVTRWGAETARRRLPGFELSEVEANQFAVVLQENLGSFVENLPAGFLDTLIEVSSEHSGALLEPGIGKASKFLQRNDVVRVLMDLQARTAAKLVPPDRLGSWMRSMMRRGGWNGFVAELGEERVADAMRAAIGEIPLKEVLPSLDQLGAEIAGFAGISAAPAVPGAMRAGVEAIKGARAPQEPQEPQGAAQRVGPEPQQAPPGTAAEEDLGPLPPEAPGQAVFNQGDQVLIRAWPTWEELKAAGLKAEPPETLGDVVSIASDGRLRVKLPDGRIELVQPGDAVMVAPALRWEQPEIDLTRPVQGPPVPPEQPVEAPTSPGGLVQATQVPKGGAPVFASKAVEPVTPAAEPADAKSELIGKEVRATTRGGTQEVSGELSGDRGRYFVRRSYQGRTFDVEVDPETIQSAEATPSPVTEEPVTEGTEAAEAATEGPVAVGPLAEEPATEEPATEELAAEESAAEEPAAAEPAAEEPAAEEEADPRRLERQIADLAVLRRTAVPDVQAQLNEEIKRLGQQVKQIRENRARRQIEEFKQKTGLSQAFEAPQVKLEDKTYKELKSAVSGLGLRISGTKNNLVKYLQQPTWLAEYTDDSGRVVRKNVVGIDYSGKQKRTVTRPLSSQSAVDKWLAKNNIRGRSVYAPLWTASNLAIQPAKSAANELSRVKPEKPSSLARTKAQRRNRDQSIDWANELGRSWKRGEAADVDVADFSRWASANKKTFDSIRPSLDQEVDWEAMIQNGLEIGEGDGDSTEAVLGSPVKRKHVAPNAPWEKLSSKLETPGGTEMAASEKTVAPSEYKRIVTGHGRRYVDRVRQLKKELAAAHERYMSGKLDPDVHDNIFNIMEDLLYRLGAAPFAANRDRRSFRNNYLGWYQAFTGEIRASSKGGVGPVYFHEIGHWLHRILFPRAVYDSGKRIGQRVSHGISSMDLPKEWSEQLIEMGHELYGNKRPNSGYAAEGWAEFVRLFIQDPGALQQKRPVLYAAVSKELQDNHPEVYLALNVARQNYANAVLYGQKFSPVREFVQYPSKLAGLAGRMRGYLEQIKFTAVAAAWDNFRYRWTDRHGRLETVMAASGMDPDDPRGALVAMRRALGHTYGDLVNIIQYGPFDPSDPMQRPLPGYIPLERFMREIEKNGQDELWQDYMVMRRAVEKRRQGKNVLRGDGSARYSSEYFLDQIERLEAQYPYFKTASEEFRKLNQWLVGEYLVYNNMLSRKTADLILLKNQEYITFSFMNQFSSASLDVSAGASVANRGSGLRYFPNDDDARRLVPPLNAWISAVTAYISNAQHNKAMVRLANMAETTPDFGRFMARVRDKQKEAMFVDRRQAVAHIKQSLDIENFDLNDEETWPDWLRESTAEQVADFSALLEETQGFVAWSERHKPDPKTNTVTVMLGGKPVAYEVKDPLLYEQLTQPIGFGGENVITRLLEFPSRALRAGATQLNPSFAIPNAFRDLVQSLIVTDTDLSNFGEQASARIKGIREAWNAGDMLRLYNASGARMSGLFSELADPKAIRLVDIIEPPRSPGRLHGDTLGHKLLDAANPFGWISRMNEFLELQTRMQEFSAAYSSRLRTLGGVGLSEEAMQEEAILYAGQRAAESTIDFQRGGRYARDLNRSIPFFNASIQGVSKLARTFAANPIKTSQRLLTFMVAPTIAQFLLLWDDDDYWALPQERRDKYWYFPLGEGTYVRLPKPYGWLAFTSVLERAIASEFGINPETGVREGDPRAFRGMWQMIQDELRPSLSIPVIMPVMEVLPEQGFSVYRNAPIVNAHDIELPREMQGAMRSSEFAKALGHFLDRPPAKIDYLIGATGGGLATDAVSVMDYGIRLAKKTLSGAVGEEVLPYIGHGEKRDVQLPVIRRLVQGEPRSSHEALTRFYTDYRHLREIHRAYKTMESQNDSRSYDYYDKHEAELYLFPFFDKASRSLTETGKEIRRMYRERDLYDADEFDAIISGLYDDSVDIAREALAEARSGIE